MVQSTLSDLNSQAVRVVWVDVLKGIGIISVVVGHIWDPSAIYIFWFHMPLFFFISGLLYRPTDSQISYIKKNTDRLLLPYLSFLVLISLPIYLKFFWNYGHQPSDQLLLKIGHFTLSLIMGGTYLKGWWGVFWFITCLYFAKILYNVCDSFAPATKFLSILAIYILAIINSFYFREIQFPLNINVSAMAITFIYAGHVVPPKLIFSNKTTVFCLFLIALTLMANLADLKGIGFNMKYCWYGIPLVSIGVALSCIQVICVLAYTLQNNEKAAYIFGNLGKASMIIMYLHSPIHLIMADYPILAHPALRIVASICIPLLVYRIFKKSHLLRKLFIGESYQVAT